MHHLRASRYETAATIRPAAATLKAILSGSPGKVDTFQIDGYCYCFVCCSTYHVEPDAFHDGCRTYYPQVMARRFREGGEP